jgi:hypothetical protein
VARRALAGTTGVLGERVDLEGFQVHQVSIPDIDKAVSCATTALDPRRLPPGATKENDWR